MPSPIPSAPAKWQPQPAARRPRSLGRRLLLWAVLVCLLIVLAAALGGAGFYFYLNEDLPKIWSLTDYRPPTVSTVYADDGSKIGEFATERRIVIPLSEMPAMLVNAFIAAEDARFRTHRGIDFMSIVRAALKNIEAGTIRQGGSTITQQVTKSFFLTPERSYLRKIKEAILAYRIDKTFTKDEILYLYLNQIYLGHGAYGAEAAAENYFGVQAKDLSLAQCALLAGLPPGPSEFSPFRNAPRARERQRYVLGRMLEEGYISAAQRDIALAEPLEFKSRRNWFREETPHFTEYVRRYVEATYGNDALMRDGLQIHTAVNIAMQKSAAEEVDLGLRQLDKRQGFRGALARVAPAEADAFVKELQKEWESEPPHAGRIVRALVSAIDTRNGNATLRLGQQSGTLPAEAMRWARRRAADANATVPAPKGGGILALGDVVWVKLEKQPAAGQPWPLSLEQTPRVQAALLCMDPASGQVKAMIGGRDFGSSQFNRATQSRRQPGSSFKPLIYAAALDRGPTRATGLRGYTPATIIVDAPIAFPGADAGEVWRPKNYKDDYHGPTPMRQALAQSRNIVTIKILDDIGVDYAIGYAKRLGITSSLEPNLSLALGASGVSLVELVGAYAPFANSGKRVEPIYITKILDRDGKVLEHHEPVLIPVMDKSTAYLMTSMLESVVQEGTGRRVAALGRPAAGKTGTTNDLKDAWFVGYTPNLLTGVWVGFDEESPLGRDETGGSAASPIWLGYMKRALANQPVEIFPIPEGVVFARVDPETGMLPSAESNRTVFECFKEGSAPVAATPRVGSVAEVEDFFKSGM